MKNTKLMTVREVRTPLFYTNQPAVLLSGEVTNKEARALLYDQYDQDKLVKVVDDGGRLIIWGL